MTAPGIFAGVTVPADSAKTPGRYRRPPPPKIPPASVTVPAARRFWRKAAG